MSAGTNRCPKCNGEMVQGFICGREGPNRVVSIWEEGAPEKVGWLFRQVRKVPPDKRVPVGVFRCSACGFLESYARPEFAAK
jgi:hypothetical protein